MPEKSSAVISYAAGASLAAVALIYVFGPNFTLDHDSASSKRKTIVGLRNQANDCFINSVLQALAGLGELRVYLIRETHRRRIEDPRVYATLVPPDGAHHPDNQDNGPPAWKLQGLQDGLVTSGLKDMLDALNERPIAKKAISPFPFVRVLETAFKQRISRQQQDAQEFLQIVAERLKDEYHAGQRARAHARKLGFIDGGSAGSLARGGGGDDNNNNSNSNSNNDDDNNNEKALRGTGSSDSLHDAINGLDIQHGGGLDASYAHVAPGIPITSRDVSKSMVEVQLLAEAAEEGFPLEGKYESHIKCQSCGYTTKPREETFCSLTLAVPQVASTTLNACFDGIFKTEYIDDFKCEMCRLLQAKTRLEEELENKHDEPGDRNTPSSPSSAARRAALENIEKLRWAIEHDPERPPEGVELGDIRHAPRRRIAKTTRMVTFPRILAVHLSRSIYDVGKTTQKNSAMVAFPEQLPLGGLMQQRRYKLLGLVTHRGGHNSGHYEAFRRQNAPSPYANCNTFMPSGVYSKTPTPASTPASTPDILAHGSASPAISTPDLLSASSASSSSSPSLASSSFLPRPALLRRKATADKDKDKDKDADASSLRSVAQSTKSALSRLAGGGRDKEKEKDKDRDRDRDRGNEREKDKDKSSNGNGNGSPLLTSSKHIRKKKPAPDKWWRVSDEKVKEAKTSDVLAMQREVYLLFYELEREE